MSKNLCSLFLIPLAFALQGCKSSQPQRAGIEINAPNNNVWVAPGTYKSKIEREKKLTVRMGVHYNGQTVLFSPDGTTTIRTGDKEYVIK